MLDAEVDSPCTNGNQGPMVQDLPDELEGQPCSREDVLLQLRDRDQWQNDHMKQRPVMYNVVVIKGTSLPAPSFQLECLRGSPLLTIDHGI